jgi:choline dehydrogenase
MLFPRVLGSFAAFISLAKAVDLTGYEYVVVGSGAGGGVSNIRELR